MVWLLWIGWIFLVGIANELIGAVFGFKFGWLIMLAVTGWFPVLVSKRIEKNRREEEYILGKQKKADEEYRKSEEGQKEEFAKLPAWKRVELMKQQEQEKKEQ